MLPVPPDRVSIDGPTTVTSSGAVYTCRVFNANPVPDVIWTVDGAVVPSTRISQKKGSQGWTVEATWSLDGILEGDRTLSLRCRARSPSAPGQSSDKQSAYKEDTLDIVVLSKLIIHQRTFVIWGSRVTPPFSQIFRSK